MTQFASRVLLLCVSTLIWLPIASAGDPSAKPSPTAAVPGEKIDSGGSFNGAHDGREEGNGPPPRHGRDRFVPQPPLATTGELIEQGRCDGQRCGPLVGPGRAGGGMVETIPRLLTTRAGGNHALIGWNPPRRGAGRGTPPISAYEVLVIAGQDYFLYRVEGEQTFGAPRGFRGVSHGPTRDGKANGSSPGRPAHRDRAQPRRYFRFVRDGVTSAEFHVRPVFGAAPGSTRGTAEGQFTGSKTSGTSGDSEFSGALEVDFNTEAGTNSRFGTTTSPLTACINANVKEQGVASAQDLTLLDCGNEGISSLDGIEDLVSLQTLILKKNNLLDLAPLSLLPNLVELDLALTGISTIDALQSLVNLRIVELTGNAITNLTPLANLNQLEELYAGQNQIAAIPDLSATSLKIVALDDNPLIDISGLAAVDTLQTALLNSTQVGDLQPLLLNSQQLNSPLSGVDLAGVPDLYCLQIDQLIATLGLHDPNASATLTGVNPPLSCKNIPTITDLDVSSNPSIGPNFQLTWTLDGGAADVSEYSFKVSRMDDQLRSVADYETTRGETLYSNQELLDIGEHSFKVQPCATDVAGGLCGGWSTFITVTVLADPGVNANQVLALDGWDSALQACINDHLVGDMDAGELIALSCINRGISDLNHLDQFPNLERIVLNQNFISNLQPIENLSLLSKLHLAYTGTDSTQLGYIVSGGAGSYFDLNLGSNNLTDVSMLGGLSAATWLSIWGNSIQSIDPLSGISIDKLYAWNNQITSIPPFENVSTLALSKNQISNLQGFCKPQPTSTQCPSGTALGDTLSLLELEENPLSLDVQAVARLSNLSAIQTAKLRSTGLDSLVFAQDWNQLRTLGISYNPIDDLSPLSGIAGLYSLDVSGTNIQNFSQLQQVPGLSSLVARDVGSLVSLAGIGSLSGLSSIRISDAQLDPVKGLNPMRQLNPRTVELASNGVFNIDALLALADQPSSLLSTADLFGEGDINCDQIATVQANPSYLGIFTLPAACMPNAPEFESVDLLEDFTSMDFAWLAPANGQVDHFNIRISDESPSGFVAEVQVTGLEQATTWSDQRLAADRPVTVEIQSCRAVGECSPFSEKRYPAYPPMAPANLELDSLVDGTATISWGYPPYVPDQDQRTVEFEIRPVFEVVETIVVPWSGTGSLGHAISNVAEYPGAIVRVVACQDRDGERLCGASAQVVARPNSGPGAVPAAPASISLSRVGTSSDQLSLTWTAPAGGGVDYYQVTELEGSNPGATYAIEALQTEPKRFTRPGTHTNPQRAFRVAACVRDRVNGDRCSDPVESDRAEVNSTPDFLPPNNICWFDDQVSQDGNLSVKLRWSQPLVESGVVHDAPQFYKFIRTRNNTDVQLAPEIAFSAGKYNPADQSWFWESDSLSVPPVNGNDGSTEPATFRIRPAADGYYTPPENHSATLQPLILNGTDYELDEALRCPTISPPTSPNDTGGPGDLKPGHWATQGALRQGWRFFWANEERDPDTNDAFGVGYDLIGVWYTYKLIGGEWSPVWYYTRMQLVQDNQGKNFFEGALIYPQNQASSDDQQVGNIKLYFELPPDADGNYPLPDDNGVSEDYQNAWMEIDIDHDGGMQGEAAFQIHDFALEHPDLLGVNRSDHYNGIWQVNGMFDEDDTQILSGEEVYFLEWISGSRYSIGVNGFDTSGEPIWLIGFAPEECSDPNAPGCSAEDQQSFGEFYELDQMHAVYPGFNPFFDGTEIEPGLDMPSYNKFATGSVSRKYANTHAPDMDARRGYICASLDLDEGQIGGREFSIDLGGGACSSETSATQEIRKTASLHAIEYEIVQGGATATTCDLDTSNTCRLHLTWYTNDAFPSAQPMVTLESGSNAGDIYHINSLCVENTESSLPYLQRDYVCNIRSSGQYRFHLVNRTEAQQMGSDSAIIASSLPISITGEFVPNPASPPTPVLADPPTEDPSSAQVGATRGEFRVGESGAASYRIPIMTAPAGGDMAPTLALSYNSQAGPGLAGRGWNLEGISSITRCAATLETDGVNGGVTLTGEDRFCLDGQRLVVINGDLYGAHGAEYRLEVDQIVKIQSFGGDINGGPAYFKVWRKDGTVSWYGATETDGTDSAGSRVSSKLSGASSVVWQWNVGRIEDSTTNYMKFAYQDMHPGESTVETILERIEYGGNADASATPINRIEIALQPISEHLVKRRYLAGMELGSSYLIKHIGSHAGSSELRRYILNYDGAQLQGLVGLTSLQECNGDPGSGAVCFPPTTFDWYETNLALGETSSQVATTIPDDQKARQYQVIDLNDDGLADLAWVEERNNDLISPLIGYRLATADDGLVRYPSSGMVRISMHSSLADADEAPPLKIFDVNGDGFKDLLYSTSENTLMAHLGTGSGFGPMIQVGGFSGSAKAVHVLDWDGDGLADLLHHNKSGPTETLAPLGLLGSLSVQRNIAAGSRGSEDTTYFEEYAEVNISNSTEHFPADKATLEDPIYFEVVPNQTFDANGDGRADMVLRLWLRTCESNCPSPQSAPGDGTTDTSSGDQPEYHYFSSYVLFESRPGGSGGVELHSVALIGLHKDNIHGGGASNIENLRVADLNADGLGDVLYYNVDASSWRFRLNLGISGGFTPELDIATEVPDGPSGWPREEQVRNSLQVLDVDGDGHPDALFPLENIFGSVTWRLSRWSYSMNQGAGGFGPPQNTDAESLDNGLSVSQFSDLNGDGKVDQARFGPFGNGNLNVHLGFGKNQITSGDSYEPLSRIRRITDGFGAWTELHYRSLVQPSVYRRGQGGPYPDFGEGSVVYDVVPPMYVVSTATSLSPQNGASCVNAGPATPDCTTRVQYFYADARIQGGGRGFLGFGEVATYDPQTGMLTRTRYHQDFPWIGRPKETRSWWLASTPWPLPSSGEAPSIPGWDEGSCTDAANGEWNNPGKIFVGCSKNTWDQITTEAPARYPYLKKSEEWNFTPVMATSGAVTGSTFTHLVVTENNGVDGYGNVGQVAVSRYTTPNPGATAFARQQTDNHYLPPDLSRWHLGRLSGSVVTSDRAGQDPVTRISTFGYDSSTGILTRETVNASHIGDPEGSLKTVYSLDDFGNRTKTEVTGADIGPIREAGTRRSKVTYEPIYARFVDEEHVEFGTGNWLRTRKVVSRDAYGNATRVENGQGVIAINAFDAMGRLYFSADSTGAGTEVQFLRSHLHCPSGTKMVEKQIPRGGAWSLICKDQLGREIRSVVQGLVQNQVIYVDTQYDFAARPVAVSEPYGPAGGAYCQSLDPEITPESTCRSTPLWTETIYDVFGRPVEVVEPNGQESTIEYGVLTETRTNPVGQQTVTTRNVLGETISETRHPEPGRPGQSTTTAFSYDALGQLETTYGPVGDDDITIDYDLLGNKTATHDPDTGSWYYDYDVSGQLRCQKDAEGNTSIFTYDALGRQIRREEFTGTPGANACATGAPAGTTEWVYGNVSGQPEFGQLIEERSQSLDSNGILETELIRTFYYTFSNSQGSDQPDPGGRVRSVMTTIGEMTSNGWRELTYTERTDYDQYGRVFQRFDASGDYRGERYEYTNGYLSAVREARYAGDSTLYQKIRAMDARGNVIRAELGNGTEITRFHDAATGELTGDLQKLPGIHNYASFREYTWDSVGRMTTRAELSGVPLHEVFEHDGLNRLTGVWSGDDPNPTVNPPQQRVRYGLSGNILCKSDVYGADCGGNDANYHYETAGPHAVTRVVTSNGTREFDYNNNGSMTRESIGTVTERSFEYTAFNKLRRVCQYECGNSVSTEFYYGPSRARFLKRKLNGAEVQDRTHYLGSVEIEFANGDLDTPRIRRIIAGVAIEIIESDTGIGELRYQHKDHLGSIVALSTSGGQLLTRMHYDPWGQRQDISGELWNQWVMSGRPVWANAMLAITPRGFTGHEHLDDHGIIHMNGRIYDPHLGRFLQADPFIEDTGTLNRYTYVHNNPLAYTDPSGYFGIKDFLRTAAVVAISVYSGGTAAGAAWGAFGATLTTAQAFTAVVVGGALAGGISAGSVEGALWGAFSGAVFFGVGQAFGGSAELGEGIFGTTFKNAGELARASLAHGIAGGTISTMQGGKFGHGFLSAGVSKAATPAAVGFSDNELVQGVLVTVVGGTTSEISGGKFANGATTAAMAFAFNQVASRDRVSDGELEDKRFRSERSALRYIQRNVEQPEGLEDGGFIHRDGKLFRVSRIIGVDQSVDLGPPPDDAVAAWHRHPDLGQGSESFSFAVSVTPDGPGPYYHYRQGDVAYSYHHQTRFYLIAPGDSLRVINPADITAVQNPRAQNFGDMFRLRWRVQK